MLANLLSVAPFVPVLIVAWDRASRGIWGEVTWGCLALFGAGAVAGLIWQRRRYSRYRCPDCGKLIVDSHKGARPGDPTNFHCDVCDVEWVTGLRAADDV